MNTQKTIDVLNTLIKVHNDCIEDNEIDSKKTNEVTLNHLFFQLSLISQKCKTELLNKMLLLGGEPAKSMSLIEKIIKALTRVKSIVTYKNRNAILNSCKHRELLALETYTKALENNLNLVSAVQQHMLNVQHQWIKSDYNVVKGLLL